MRDYCTPWLCVQRTLHVYCLHSNQGTPETQFAIYVYANNYHKVSNAACYHTNVVLSVVLLNSPYRNSKL